MRLDCPTAFLPFMRDLVICHVQTDAGEAVACVKACVFPPDTSAGVALAPSGWNTVVAFRLSDWTEREIPSVGSTIDADGESNRWPVLTVQKAWKQDGIVFLSCSGGEVAL